MSHIGFIRIDRIPDFLLDHTLLGREPHERITEHGRRWTQFVGSLWTGTTDVGYSLRYLYRAAQRTIQPEVVVRAPNPAQLRANQGRLVSGLDAMGFIVQSSSQSLCPTTHMSAAYELTQFDEVVYPLFPDTSTAWTSTSQQSPHLYNVVPWWGPGGSFLLPFRILMQQHSDVLIAVTLIPTVLSTDSGIGEDHDEAKLLASIAARGRSLAVDNWTAGSGRMFADRDPIADRVGHLAEMNLRRLANPFLAVVHSLSNSQEAAESVARAIGNEVTYVRSFDPPIGEQEPLPSLAGMRKIDPDSAASALNEVKFLQQHHTTPLRAAETRLRYLVDAQGAATVFRFPVNIRGGVPGLRIRQAPPSVDPGPRPYMHDSHVDLGTLESGGIAQISYDDLARHTLIVGFTGSGKSFTARLLLHQLWNRAPTRRVPFLVLESAKKEYRGLLRVRSWADSEKLRVYTLGNDAGVPFRMNPFALLPGVRVETHLSSLRACFESSMPQFGILPSILAEALERVYRDKGWSLEDEGGMPAPPPIPTLSDFSESIESVVQRREYAGELAMNVRAAACGRIKRLLLGSLGRMLLRRTKGS